MKITDITRNDVEACVRYHDENDGVTPEEAEGMIMLQSDPGEILRLMKHWKTRYAS